MNIGLSYHELPLNINEKYEFLKNRLIGEDDSLLKHLADLQSVRYIVDQPTFIHYYIEDDKILSKPITCNTFPIFSIKSSPFPYALVLYSIVDINSTKYLRGAYVEYDYRRMRDAKIDQIIGQ